MKLKCTIRTGAKSVLVAATLVPALASAVPSETLIGGGATLPASAYSGTSWLTGNPPAGGSNPVPASPKRLTAEADAGSLFGQYTASTTATPIGFPAGSTTRPKVSYCQTGSGTGKNVLTGGSAGTVVASGTCPDYPTSATGFGAAEGVQAHFAGTDSPLSTADWGYFLTNKAATRLQPVQFPSVAAAISVIFNNSGVTKQLVLSESKVCRIFAGQINNWSQLGFASKPIQLVYRSDGSGTSFGFSNHLSKVCPNALPTGVSGFSTQQTFSLAFPGGTPPAGAVGASGNGAVTLAVSTTDGALGYADVADTAVRQQLDPTIQLQIANIKLRDGINPATGKTYRARSPLALPRTLAVSLVNDRVVGANDANGRPTIEAITPAPPRAGCIRLAPPDSYATAPLNTLGDYTRYPIVAITYLLANATGNGADTRNIQALLATPFTAGADGSLSDGTVTVGVDKGFTYLTFPNPITRIKTCITQ